MPFVQTWHTGKPNFRKTTNFNVFFMLPYASACGHLENPPLQITAVVNQSI